MRLFALLLLSAFITSCGSQRYAANDSSTSGWNYNENNYGGFTSNLEQESRDNFNTELMGVIPGHQGLIQDKTSLPVIIGGTPAEYEDKKDPSIQKKIIYNANLRMSVKRPDTTNKDLVKIAERYEGYAQSVATDYTVIRVKADKLDMALKDIEELGKIDYRNVKADDVTDQYYDYKIRLDNAEKARQRYLDLLAKAANVDETLKVEKELERLNGEIDLLKGRLTRLDHLNAYATISIRLQEKVKPGILGYVFIGAYEGIKWLFVRN